MHTNLLLLNFIGQLLGGGQHFNGSFILQYVSFRGRQHFQNLVFNLLQLPVRHQQQEKTAKYTLHNTVGIHYIHIHMYVATKYAGPPIYHVYTFEIPASVTAPSFIGKCAATVKCFVQTSQLGIVFPSITPATNYCNVPHLLLAADCRMSWFFSSSSSGLSRATTMPRSWSCSPSIVIMKLSSVTCGEGEGHMEGWREGEETVG